VRPLQTRGRTFRGGKCPQHSPHVQDQGMLAKTPNRRVPDPPRGKRGPVFGNQTELPKQILWVSGGPCRRTGGRCGGECDSAIKPKPTDSGLSAESRGGAPFRSHHPVPFPD